MVAPSAAGPIRPSSPGSPRHPGRRAGLAATAVSPSLAAAELADCAALAAEWGLRWVPRSRPTSWPSPPTGQRRRPLLLVQGRPDGRLVALAAAEGATVVLGRQRRRPGRPPPRASGRRRAGAPLSPGRRRLHQGRRARRPDGSACAPGTSRRPRASRPGLYGRRSRWAAWAGSSGPRRPAALGFRGAGAPLRGHGPTGGPAGIADLVALREEVVAAPRARYRYVTLDLEGLRSGNLNAALGLSARGGDATTGYAPLSGKGCSAWRARGDARKWTSPGASTSGPCRPVARRTHRESATITLAVVARQVPAGGTRRARAWASTTATTLVGRRDDARPEAQETTHAVGGDWPRSGGRSAQSHGGGRDRIRRHVHDARREPGVGGRDHLDALGTSASPDLSCVGLLAGARRRPPCRCRGGT